MSRHKKLFLSSVNSEFATYRKLLAADLKRPDLDVAVKEDFIVTGGSTLGKLDDYIRACDGVIHLIGKATGAVLEEPAVAALLARYPDFATKLPILAEHLGKPQPGFSYTQWEAYLAMYHQRPLFVYRPTDFELDALDVPRDARSLFNPIEAQSQKEHYQRISALGHDRGQFLNEERLSSAVLRDLVEILPRLEPTIEVPATKLRHTAERLIGRDEDLARLDSAWNDAHKNIVIVRAFGGMGKTSLVASWMAELALKNWRGAERVFDWSFYSQGTNDQRAASADAFIAAALHAFGDPDPTLGSAWDRGARLARLVGKVRCLLVLDGLEPLQYPPGPMEGKLKDAAIEALLKGLAAQNIGLCVVTTREKVPDIQQHYGRTADDIALTALTDLAGAALLHHHGATRAGAKEIARADKTLQTASREVRGHGLTLQLLGQYLRLVENGDILKRDTVRLADADREYQNDATRPYGHAFKAMEAYEKWFQREGQRGERQLAVLRLLGLFDRPASRGCLDALRKEPVITGLTEPLVGLSPRDWTLVASRLEEINLVTVQTDGSVDAHPLLREYFARRVRQQQPEAWRAAHRRLYEYLCATTNEGDQPTLEDLQPLYQAVAHGCQAGLQQEAVERVFIPRIRRGNRHYSFYHLGAAASDLASLSTFTQGDWHRVASGLDEPGKAYVINEVGSCLRAIGRLVESIDPIKESLEIRKALGDFAGGSRSARNLAGAYIALGQLRDAIDVARQAVELADESPDPFDKYANHYWLARAFHFAGRVDARAAFEEANKRAKGKLVGLQAAFFCDFLLDTNLLNEAVAVARFAIRSENLTQWTRDNAFCHLALAQALLRQHSRSLCDGVLCSENNELAELSEHLDEALRGLRKTLRQDEIPAGLLTRAWLRSLTGARTGPESAQSDLDEAWEIAERGPMRLHMADIHLHRARLFGSRISDSELRNEEAEGGVRNEASEPYPWESPQADLEAAEKLINDCGYHRRDEELADAKKAILG